MLVLWRFWSKRGSMNTRGEGLEGGAGTGTGAGQLANLKPSGIQRGEPR